MRFPEVNCLRGLAILGVLWCHLFPPISQSIPAIFPAGWAAHRLGNANYFWLGSFLTSSWSGVNLFFVLSGFVLFLPYALHSRQMDGATSAIKFYRHRSVRLMPLFVINAVVSCFLYCQLHPAQLSSLIQELALVLSSVFIFTPLHFQPSFNFVLWSLGVEIWFSILFVPLCFLIRRHGLVKIISGVFVLSLAVRLAGAFFYHHPVSNPYLHPIKDSIFGRLDDFFAGIVVASLFARRQSLKFSAFTGAVFAILGILSVWVGMALWDASVLLKIPAWSTAFFNILLNCGFGAILWGCISLRSSGGGLVAGFLQNYALQGMGMMCYSIYIWHAMALRIIHHRRDVLSIGEYLVVLLVVSVISYRYIEFFKTSNWRDLLPRKNVPKLLNANAAVRP